MANFNFNQVTLGGRLTSDVELKQTQNGISTADFRIAINRRPSKAGAEQQTDFINCQVWRGTAEFVSKYFRKGSSICVVGEIRADNYVDKDGNKRVKTFVLVNDARFVDGTGNNTTADTAPTTTDAVPSANTAFEPFESISDDDMPF